MTGQLNFEAEPFREYGAFSNESSEEFGVGRRGRFGRRRFPRRFQRMNPFMDDGSGGFGPGRELRGVQRREC